MSVSGGQPGIKAGWESCACGLDEDLGNVVLFSDIYVDCMRNLERVWLSKDLFRVAE